MCPVPWAFPVSFRDAYGLGRPLPSCDLRSASSSLTMVRNKCAAASIAMKNEPKTLTHQIGESDELTRPTDHTQAKTTRNFVFKGSTGQSRVLRRRVSERRC